MHQEKKSVKEAPSSSATRRVTLIVFALIFAAGATLAAWHVITSTQASTSAIEKTLTTYSLKNEGAQTLARYKEKHSFLGSLISSPIQKALKLPSQGQADEALYDDVPRLLKSVRKESSVAAWWSWFLITLSLVYVGATMAVERRHNTRAVLFAMTSISVVFFFIGIIAPAMVIWTAPTIPMETGDLSFVVQHQVRGIAAIIWELITGGHWMIGGFLLLFSIITPLTKASLTYFATASHSKDLNFKIGQLLHSIGKWSMADVFVAAILLSLYALKFQQATRSIPCLGLYYFIGYCLLALTTTELLVRSGVVTGEEKPSRSKFGLEVIGGILAAVFCLSAATGLYTYQQYTANTKEKVRNIDNPSKLDNADLVLPGHKDK